MEGIGCSAIDFVYDEYSSIFFNPAYINKTQRTWLFSNLNNIQSGLNKDRLMNQRNLGDFSLLPYPLYDNKGWFKVNDFDIPVNLVGIMTPIGSLNWLIMIENGGLMGKADILLEEQGDNSGTPPSPYDVNLDQYSVDGTFYMYGAVLGVGFSRNIGLLIGFKKWSIHGEFQEKSKYESYDAAGSLAYESENIETYRADMDLMQIEAKLGILFDFSAGSQQGLVLYSEPKLISISGSMIDQYKYTPWFDPSQENQDDNADGAYIKGDGYSVGLKFYSRKGLKQNSTIRKFFGGNAVDWTWIFDANYSYIPLEASFTNYNYSFTIWSPSETEMIEEIERLNGEGTGHLISGIIGGGSAVKVSDNALITFGLKLKMYYLNSSITYKRPEEITRYRYFVDDNDPLTDTAYTRTYHSSGEATYDVSGFAGLINIPIGLEVKLFKKLFLRLGADSIMPAFLMAEVNGGWDDKWEDSIEYTEGILKGNQNTIEGDPNDIEETYDARLLASMVSYSFGAGYQVNDSISIDLLHFAKLTDLSTWLFSVTIGFGAPERNHIDE